LGIPKRSDTPVEPLWAAQNKPLSVATPIGQHKTNKQPLQHRLGSLITLNKDVEDG
jgi:hypothetical protein